MPKFDFEMVSSASKLRRFCEEIASAHDIAFDTEFISERSYRPELCLIQILADDRLAVIDPFACGDVTRLWECLAKGEHETVVHAGREETLFCLRAVGEVPARLFDVQLAAAFVGLEFPAGYGTLVSKVLGVKSSKAETRTDWRRRPLSTKQLQYAVEDVAHLREIRDELRRRLVKLDREAWFREEMEARIAMLKDSLQPRSWRKLSGIQQLPRASLAVARELCRWRDEQARERNRPARHVLRDDLIVELAKRRTADPNRIRAVRGFDRKHLASLVPELAAVIENALSLPEEDLPPRKQRDPVPQMSLICQFMMAAVTARCRRAGIAPGLLATSQDLRDYVAWHLRDSGGEEVFPSPLTRGWRKEAIGTLLEDLLAGKVGLRLGDLRSEGPLDFE